MTLLLLTVKGISIIFYTCQNKNFDIFPNKFRFDEQFSCFKHKYFRLHFVHYCSLNRAPGLNLCQFEFECKIMFECVQMPRQY